jgi:phosphatidylglycerophosphatase A
MSTSENPDPGSATWDEFVGMWLTCLFIPFGSPVWLTVAFFVFRALDVLKPWPCGRLERLPGGWGIMLDDVAAGLWGALLMLLGPQASLAAYWVIAMLRDTFLT